MVESTGRTVICSIVFMDIVGFSKTPVTTQLVMKDRLNSHIRRAVIDISEAERIVIDTGDGVALCFTGDPEDAVFVATAVNDAIRRGGAEVVMTLRIGINLGPVKTVIDLNGQQNVIGDGINVAERVMSFAGENEILISRSYYEVVARLNERYAKLFHYIGMKKDKHIREHQIYALGSLAPKPMEPEPPSAELAYQATDAFAGDLEVVPVPEPGPEPVFPAEWLAAEEQRLTDLIGPLAKVVVARAAQSARDRQAFYDTIASVIPDSADRAGFLAAVPGAPADDLVEPVADAGAEPVPEPAAATSEEATATPAKPTELLLAEIERHLTGHLGPLASVLVKKAAQRTTSLDDLCAELAEHIKDEAARQRFLAAFRP